MIEEQKCIICGHSLEDVDDIESGLCSKHRKDIESSNHLTIACWNCGKIIGTAHKREVVRGARIKDDYLFAKECPNCSSVSINKLPFVTVDTNIGDNALCITPNGELQKQNSSTMTPIA